MKRLIKLGGTLLDSQESRARLAQEIASLEQTVVVHGGGKQMTRYLAERGVESHFINGLRVTTAEVIDAVLKVFAGTVNTELVAAFRAAGANPVGLTGLDSGLVDAELLDNGALGAVGRPHRSDARLLNLLTRERYLPIIACVAGDANGRVYNVNADQMAVACASSFGAGSLIFLTDVDGVKGANGNILESLAAADAAELICTGVATGGMQAKLEAAVAALNAGVSEIVIAPGGKTGIVGEILAGLPVGTRIVR